MHAIIYLTSYVLLGIQDVCLFISYLNSNIEKVHPLCGQLYQDKFIDVGFLHQSIVTFSHLGYMLADCFQKGGSNLLLTVVYFPINVPTLDIRTRIFIQARHKHEKKKKRSNGNQSPSKLLLVMKLTCPATMMGNINGFYLPHEKHGGALDYIYIYH